MTSFLYGHVDPSLLHASNSSTLQVNVPDMLELMQRMKAKEDLRKSRAYFAILGTKCGSCGEAVEYKETPETLVICRHVLEQLRRRCREVDQPQAHMSQLFALRIEVKE